MELSSPQGPGDPPHLRRSARNKSSPGKVASPRFRQESRVKKTRKTDTGRPHGIRDVQQLPIRSLRSAHHATKPHLTLRIRNTQQLPVRSLRSERRSTRSTPAMFTSNAQELPSQPLQSESYLSKSGPAPRTRSAKQLPMNSPQLPRRSGRTALAQNPRDIQKLPMDTPSPTQSSTEPPSPAGSCTGDDLEWIIRDIFYRALVQKLPEEQQTDMEALAEVEKRLDAAGLYVPPKSFAKDPLSAAYARIPMKSSSPQVTSASGPLYIVRDWWIQDIYHSLPMDQRDEESLRAVRIRLNLDAAKLYVPPKSLATNSFEGVVMRISTKPTSPQKPPSPQKQSTKEAAKKSQEHGLAYCIGDLHPPDYSESESEGPARPTPTQQTMDIYDGILHGPSPHSMAREWTMDEYD